MNSKVSRAKRLYLIGLTALIAAALWFGAVSPILGAFRSIDQQIESGIANRERIQAAVSRLQFGPLSGVTPDGLFWTGASANLILADFQRVLSEGAATNQIRFNSVTPLAMADVAAFNTVSLRVEGEAGFSDLLSFLDMVLKASPKVAVSAFSIRHIPATQGSIQIRVSFQITFWAVIKVEEES